MTSWLADKAVNAPQKVRMANGDSKMSAIENISTSQPAAVKIRPAGENVVLSFANVPSQSFNVKVYTVSGQLVTEQTVSANGEREFSIATPATGKGIYVVQVTSSEKGVTGSDLIRF